MYLADGLGHILGTPTTCFSRYLPVRFRPPDRLFTSSPLKVRREKALVFCGGESQPATRSLQPEAIAAGREVTNYLKPAMERAALAAPRACRSQHV